ncbi:hypothetical protein [Duncaniella freteri]|uniref:hypothetical protein n=1 Tax=Duncaniella freteri TaxID=2530391 RepID=UPI003F666CEF
MADSYTISDVGAHEFFSELEDSLVEKVGSKGEFHTLPGAIDSRVPVCVLAPKRALTEKKG